MDAYHRLARPAARTLTAALAAALVAVAPAHAQQGGGGQGQADQQQLQQAQQFQEVQRLQQQVRQIQQRLGEIQDSAMQDSAIQKKYMALQETVRDAMEELDAQVVQKEDSLNALQRRLNEARQNQDTAAVREVVQAGRPLSQELNQLRDSVMQRDSLSERAQQLRQELEEKMASINDSVPTLIQRRDSLMQRLQQLAQQLRGQQQVPQGQGGGGMPGGGGQ